jgi:hypothetical protein
MADPAVADPAVADPAVVPARGSADGRADDFIAACSRAWMSDVVRGVSAAAAGRSECPPGIDEPGWLTTAGRSEIGTCTGAWD